ncbi:cell wall hydrolase [Bradyrhizobium sp.]|uniref:cell wall hydrolase n=1 Tax=Bradyrhizobium sp. TaxID=376 RepID=UPI003C46DEF0
MVALRTRPKGARFASFGLGLCVFSLMPNQIGYQDIASLLARQPGVAERWQKRVSPAAASIQLATYSFGRPLGTSEPVSASYRLARLDDQGSDFTGSVTHNPILQTPSRYQPSDFPKVDRTLKGDRLVVQPPAQPANGAPAAKGPSLEPPSTSNASVRGAKTAAASSAAPAISGLDPELQEAMLAPPLPQYDAAMPLDTGQHDALKTASAAAATESEVAPSQDGFDVKTSSLFFGTSALGGAAESIERWEPGEEPMVVVPDTAPDPDLKATASLPPAPEAAARTNDKANDNKSGESIAPKGEVNADNQHVKTPAERLGLFDRKARAKSEKCLSEAVYFEARGEAVRGQIAVAQVVLNRAFSGYYPTTVCAVVYQNKHGRPFECQFTFACDNIPDVVREPDMWDRAKKIAAAMLDGQIWLPEVGKSTHYHAYWVHPSWVSEMKRMYKYGVHTFYRPKAWGDGSDAPSWGTPAQTAALSQELVHEAKSEAELNPNSVRR